jgi:hypothetical protein
MIINIRCNVVRTHGITPRSAITISQSPPRDARTHTHDVYASPSSRCMHSCIHAFMHACIRALCVLSSSSRPDAFDDDDANIQSRRIIIATTPEARAHSFIHSFMHSCRVRLQVKLTEYIV